MKSLNGGDGFPSRGSVQVMKRRVVLAEDHNILRQGLTKIVASLPDCEVVGEARDGVEAIRVVEECEPDLIIIDLLMPQLNGVDAIGALRSRRQKLKIMVLTAYKDEQYVMAAFRAGADAYLLKDDSKQVLIAAIRKVFEEKKYISPFLACDYDAGFLDGDINTRCPPAATLTTRERQVLELIARGHTTKQISGILSIAVKTVSTHRTNLMRKLNLNGISKLTAYALRRETATGGTE